MTTPEIGDSEQKSKSTSLTIRRCRRKIFHRSAKPNSSVVAETQTLETPTDPVEAPTRKRRRKYTKRRLFDDDQGDYRIYRILPSSKELPTGAFTPIPQVPGFQNKVEMDRFIRANEGLFEGMQFLMFKALEIGDVNVRTIKKVTVRFKPKRVIDGGEHEDVSG
jgi:hypothetical protein